MAGKLDLDLDLDLDLAVHGGRRQSARYNTEDYPKLAPIPPTVSVPTKTYDPGWAPEYRAWAYLYDFVASFMAGGVLTNPIDAVRDQINAQNFFPVPNDPAAVNRLNTTAKMTAQIRGMLDASIDRADLTLEILDQAASGSALRYWTGLLHIDPSKERHTFLLILVVGKIGEFVAMGLKDHYKMRRPAQVYPWIMPLIDGPDTPSFPSSHSLQAHLISGALKLALQAPEFWPPAAWPPAAWPPGSSTGQTAKALDVLADRVARNREVAGVHYPMDSAAGYYAALYCLFLLRTKVVSIQNLINDVKGELSDLP